MPCPYNEAIVRDKVRYEPEKRRRRSIRLKGYDYSQAGAHFVTICAHDKKCLFGDVVNGEMKLAGIGMIADECWRGIPDHFSDTTLDSFTVMPNHVHGILIIRRGTACRAPTMEQFGRPVANSLPTIIRSYKSAVTKQTNELRKTPGPPVWQRNYYEHVIRNEEDLSETREYITINPLRWDLDKENPVNLESR